MKQFIYLFSVLLLISSCSTLDSVNSLVRKADPKYKLKYIDNSTFVASVPMISKTKFESLQTKQEEYNKVSDELTFLKTYNTDLGKISRIIELRKEKKKLQNEIDEFSLIEYDSIAYIHLSFDERSLSEETILKYIYYWDYSNFRFLVPLLPFFNEEHKRNQCVNRAIEACYTSRSSSVVISPTLNHFKLYRNQ